MINQIPPSHLIQLTRNLLERCERIDKHFSDYKEINEENRRKTVVFQDFLPKLKPSKVDQQYLDDYFGNIEWIDARVNEWLNHSTPELYIIFDRKDIPSELFPFLNREMKRFTLYHVCRKWIRISDDLPVYESKISEIKSKLQRMLFLTNAYSTSVHLNEDEVEFLHTLEKDLERAEDFLGLEPIFFYKEITHTDLINIIG